MTGFILQVLSDRDTARANNVNTGKFLLQSTIENVSVFELKSIQITDCNLAIRLIEISI